MEDGTNEDSARMDEWEDSPTGRGPNCSRPFILFFPFHLLLYGGTKTCAQRAVEGGGSLLL